MLGMMVSFKDTGRIGVVMYTEDGMYFVRLLEETGSKFKIVSDSYVIAKVESFELYNDYHKNDKMEAV